MHPSETVNFNPGLGAIEAIPFGHGKGSRFLRPEQGAGLGSLPCGQDFDGLLVPLVSPVHFLQ